MHGNDHRTAAIDTIDQGYNNRSRSFVRSYRWSGAAIEGHNESSLSSAAHVGQPECCLAVNESIGRIISNIAIIIIFFLGNRCIGRKEGEEEEEGEIFPINISMGNITNAALPAASLQHFGNMLGELDFVHQDTIVMNPT